MLYEYNAEANALLRAQSEEIEVAIRRFINYIESVNQISIYLNECVASALPEGFDAKEEIKEVSANLHTRFGPFPPHGKGEAAEVYLILKAFAEDGIESSMIFYPYGHGSKKFADMCKGFLDEVARKLINAIETHLTLIGIDAGLDERIQQTNNFNNDGPASAVVASGDSSVSVTQTSGFDSNELERLLRSVQESASSLDEKSQKEIAELLVGIREAVECAVPKKSILKSLLGGLNVLSSSAQFAVAVANLAQFISSIGL